MDGKHGNITPIIRHRIRDDEQYRENLRFGKENYFHVLVFYGLFYKIIRRVYLESTERNLVIEKFRCAFFHK